MGYRSTIYIKCKKDIENSLLDVLKQQDLIGEYGFHKVDENKDFVKYVANDLKWYDGYKDVKAVTDFIIKNYDKCGLLGIGEDGAENVRTGDTDNLNMWIVINIEW